MRTLAVISRKGGVGKTTLSVNLAVTAYLAGVTTVVADLDSQRSATAWAKARKVPGPAVLETTRGKIFPLWAAAANAGTELFIIDTPASPEEDVLQAARMADLALLVTRPNYFDIAAIAQSVELLRRIGKPGLIVLNQAPPRRGGMEAPAVLNAVDALSQCGMPLARIGLRQRAGFSLGAGQGLAIQEIDPLGRGAGEMTGLWTQVQAALGGGSAEVHSPAPLLPPLHAIDRAGPAWRGGLVPPR